MAKEEFDPVKAGQEEAAKNAKADKKATALKGEPVANVEEAQKLAKKNAKLDDKARGEAELVPQKVGTSEVTVPEGDPITGEESEEEEAPVNTETEDTSSTEDDGESNNSADKK